MLRIRLLHRTIIVGALVLGLLFADILRPAPSAADTETDVIIATCAFAGYMALVLGITLIIYHHREKERPQQPTRDPYEFASYRTPSRPNDGLRFGTACTGHAPGTLFCW